MLIGLRMRTFFSKRSGAASQQWEDTSTKTNTASRCNEAASPASRRAMKSTGLLWECYGRKFDRKAPASTGLRKTVEVGNVSRLLDQSLSLSGTQVRPARSYRDATLDPVPNNTCNVFEIGGWSPFPSEGCVPIERSVLASSSCKTIFEPFLHSLSVRN